MKFSKRMVSHANLDHMFVKGRSDQALDLSIYSKGMHSKVNFLKCQIIKMIKKVVLHY